MFHLRQEPEMPNFKTKTCTLSKTPDLHCVKIAAFYPRVYLYTDPKPAYPGFGLCIGGLCTQRLQTTDGGSAMWFFSNTANEGAKKKGEIGSETGPGR